MEFVKAPGFISSCFALQSAWLRTNMRGSLRVRSSALQNPFLLSMANSLQATRMEVVKVLSRDLAKQYLSPSELNWDIYDKSITFDDPTTNLRGKLAYKGMLLTIGLMIIPTLFKDDTYFELKECALTEEGDKVRTVFETKGTTRWGSTVTISGTDFFWFGERSSLIIRHQSTWDQSVDEVKRAFIGQR